VELKVPKLRKATFETAIIERYRRRESSVEEALMEMYLAGVSVRRVENITQALWGMRVSAGTVSDVNQKIYERIEAWRNRLIEGTYPYVYVDGISLKRTWGGEVRNVAVLVAVGVGEDGYRDILGIAEGCKEDKADWSGFLAYLNLSSLRYAGLTLGGRPERGASFNEAMPRSFQRCRIRVRVLGASPVACAINRLDAPSADSNRQTARLPTRGVGGRSRSCCRR
jgi:transposase-like protein